MGEAEARSILAEQGKISLNCEFCNQSYFYQEKDIDGLFGQAADSTLH
jgi:molecular chaperone Hsp33